MASLPGFFALTFLLTWTLWIGSASAGPLRTALLYLGVFAPAFVALALTARSEGRTGVVALLRRLVEWRVAGRWYLFALGYMIVIKLGVAVVHRLATGAWPRFTDDPLQYLFLGVAGSVVTFWGQMGEEIGWRGYALPRLAERIGLRGGSVLLGVVWAVWHLPLFFLPATTTTGQSFPLYLMQVTAVSVAIAWLYAHTGGSLLLVMLLHASMNNTRNLVPSAVPGAANPWTLHGSLVGWLTVSLLWASAAYFLARMPKGIRLALVSPSTASRDG